ncbi:hypothetical protein NDU88_006112 [Pleurodeles waltl]|uniref:Uncharacterized protein n=1 Tax=Pleurodeles waltl TaxID=8319 RepID=A0AAV7MIW4_PLEWA|nr:hypothetical protein NDU88_006112 [Pleurodeles waltl]
MDTPRASHLQGIGSRHSLLLRGNRGSRHVSGLAPPSSSHRVRLSSDAGAGSLRGSGWPPRPCPKRQAKRPVSVGRGLPRKESAPTPNAHIDIAQLARISARTWIGAAPKAY